MGKGKFPFRRTVEFLSSGNLILQKRLRTIVVYVTTQHSSKGLRDFVLRDLPQIQYKNPNKQVVLLKNHHEFPHITLFYDGAERQMIDVYKKSADEILNAVSLVGAATESELLKKKEVQFPGRLNPANFGKYGHCFCICEKPGQAPCPAVTKCKKSTKWWQDESLKKEAKIA